MSLFRAVQQGSHKADVITYNAVIGAFVKGQQWQLALLLLREAPAGNFKADVINCSADIGARGKSLQRMEV